MENNAAYVSRPEWEKERTDIDIQEDLSRRQEPESNSDSYSISQASQDLIRKALERHNGTRKKAAEELGISERTLYRKLPPEFRNIKKEE